MCPCWRDCWSNFRAAPMPMMLITEPMSTRILSLPGVNVLSMPSECAKWMPAVVDMARVSVPTCILSLLWWTMNWFRV
eukprot:4871671-Pyramimonas_sp.AAC.1